MRGVRSVRDVRGIMPGRKITITPEYPTLMMQDCPPDRIPALLAHIESRPWYTAVRFLLRTGRARVMVDDPARPRAVTVTTSAGAYFVPLGSVEPLVDFLAEEPGIARIWVSNPEAEGILEKTVIGEDRTPITVFAAPTDWRPVAPDVTGPVARLLGPADTAAVSALIRGGGEWLTDGFGSAAVLLAEGMAAGVEADGQLISVAATLAVAPPYVEVGAHTMSEARGRGAATASVHVLFAAIAARDWLPQWTTFASDEPMARRVGLVPADVGVEYRRDE